jgi:hypothetical protein
VGLSVLVTVGGTGVAVGRTGVGLEGMVEGIGSVSVGTSSVSFLRIIVQATMGKTSRTTNLIFIRTTLSCMSRLTIQAIVQLTFVPDPPNGAAYAPEKVGLAAKERIAISCSLKTFFYDLF